jgi:hypothetical protein
METDSPRFTEIGEREDGSKWPWSEDAEHACDFWHPCPFGAVGDRIWVRETFQGPLFDYDLMDNHCKDPTRLRSPNSAFTRLMECQRQSFTMQMMNCIAAGDHLSTCRGAGPAAFCWKSPMYGLRG